MYKRERKFGKESKRGEKGENQSSRAERKLIKRIQISFLVRKMKIILYNLEKKTISSKNGHQAFIIKTEECKERS